MDSLSADIVEQSKSYLSQLWWYQQQHSTLLLGTPGGDSSRASSTFQSQASASANTSDSMNQLCRVCGEPAAGFHFGAFTCEGCKSFFGRTYNNLSSISECKNGNQCVINKKNRTSCKACRLRKCLVVGMSKSGSRYGRRSNWFKIHCLLQEQSNNNNNNSIKNIQQASMKKVETWNDKNGSQSPPRSSESINSSSEIRNLELQNFAPDLRNLAVLRNISELRNLPELRNLELRSDLHNLRKYEDTRTKLNKLPIEFHSVPNLALHNLPLELRNYVSKISEFQNISTANRSLSETHNFSMDVNQKCVEVREKTVQIRHFESKIPTQLHEQKPCEIEPRNIPVETNEKTTEIRNITPNPAVPIWSNSHRIPSFLTSPFINSNPLLLIPNVQSNKDVPKEQLSGLELLRTLGPEQELPMDLSVKNQSQKVNSDSEHKINDKIIVKHEIVSEKLSCVSPVHAE